MGGEGEPESQDTLCFVCLEGDRDAADGEAARARVCRCASRVHLACMRDLIKRVPAHAAGTCPVCREPYACMEEHTTRRCCVVVDATILIYDLVMIGACVAAVLVLAFARSTPTQRTLSDAFLFVLVVVASASFGAGLVTRSMGRHPAPASDGCLVCSLRPWMVERTRRVRARHFERRVSPAAEELEGA